MKTLAWEQCRTELARRLATLQPGSTARWGRMSVHQMVCHLCDSTRMALGERQASHATGPLQRTVVKWIALYAPFRWPAGLQTRPEVDQECGGTTPVDFAADIAELGALLDRLATRAEGEHRAAHPVFGRMSRSAWLRWAYLHTDHHLRQFGS